MKVPQIPNNSLTEEIKEIVELCEQLEDDYDFQFDEPATADEIKEWEEKNGIEIPQLYKEWLDFSGDSRILNGLAHFYGTKMMGEYNEYVPDELVVIGELIGDGEFLCFSKESGEIVRYNHGKIKRLEDFKLFLNKFLLRMLRDEMI